MKKIVGIFVCMLFIGNVLSVTGTLINNNITQTLNLGKTLYVGGDGPGNYSKIQDAIDDAENGNTIFVYAGIYFENLLIDKSIILVGESKETTIIDGKDWDIIVIDYYIDNVSISGFSFQNGRVGICGIYSNNIIVEDNNFWKNNGITLLNTAGNIINNNNFRKTFNGVYFYKTKNSIISNNDFLNCNYSIYIKTHSDSNIISDNNIGNSIYHGLKIYHYCKNNEICRNNFIDNVDIFDETCIDNTFYHNNFLLNNFMATDDGTNAWDNGEEGNYWKNYEGYDIFPRDGVGDTPYIIPGSLNKDNYPLMKPWSNSRYRTSTIITSLFVPNWMQLLDMFPLLQRILDMLIVG